MWSPVEKTALAEAEIEYEDHTSVTIYARFPVQFSPLEVLNDANIVIWTTTPWTMPGNRAIAYGDDIYTASLKYRQSRIMFFCATVISFALLMNYVMRWRMR